MEQFCLGNLGIVGTHRCCVWSPLSFLSAVLPCPLSVHRFLFYRFSLRIPGSWVPFPEQPCRRPQRMTHERKHSCARRSLEQDHCETSVPPSRAVEETLDPDLRRSTGTRSFRTECLVNSGSISTGLLTCLLPMKCECPSREVVEDASAGGRACGTLHTSSCCFRAKTGIQTRYNWQSRCDVRGLTKPCSHSACSDHLKGDGVAGLRRIPRWVSSFASG